MMTGLKRCVLIVGLVLLLFGATGAAQGLGDGRQVRTGTAGIGDLRRDGGEAPSKGYTWTTTDEFHPAPVSHIATQEAAADGEADLAVTKTDEPDPVVAGEALTYTLTVTNSGPVTATGMIVTDTLPSGVTFDSDVPSQGTYNFTTGVWTVGSVADGDSATLTLLVTVGPSTRGTLPNTAEVSATEPDPTPGDNTYTEFTTVNAEADLAVTKADSPDPVIAGETLTYTLTVTNSGPVTATGVIVTDTLPVGVTFDSDVPSQGTYNSGTGVWTVGSLPDGASTTLAIVLDVDPSRTAGLVNSATVSGNEFDPNAGNDTDTQSTSVETAADLAITKSDNPDPVTAGEALTYTLVITNSGPSDATGVVVTDTLPLSVTLDSDTPSQGTYNSTTGRWTVGPVADGDSATLMLLVTVDPSTRGTLSDIAEVSAAEPDPVPGNNVAGQGTVVVAEVDLALVKSDAPDPVIAGEALTYTLTVTNSGPSDATGVVVTDALPGDVTLSSATYSQGTCSGFAPVTCNMGAVASGDNVTVSLVVTVTSPLPNGTILTNAATVYGNEFDPYSVQAQTTVQSSPVLTITKTEDSDPVDPGGFLVYTLVITNSGNENATSVTVTEHYDPNVSFVYANPGPDHGSGSQVWTLDTVEVATPKPIDVIVQVARPFPPGAVLTNRATLDSSQTTPVTVTEVTAVTSEPELTLIKVGAPTVQAGSDLVYFIMCQNFGPATAEEVVITETYDSRVTFVSAEPAPRDGPGNVWDIPGGLHVGETYSIAVTVTVDTPLTNGTILTNRVTMDSKYTSPQSVTETTRVVSEPDLTLSVTDHPDPVDAGTSLTYTLRYTNTGNADATQVVVNATLDSRILLTSTTPLTSGGSAPVWHWNVDTIAGEGGHGEIVIHTDVPLAILDGEILTFTAQLQYAEGDPLEHKAQTEVQSLPDLFIQKVGEGHAPSLFSPGEQMAYVVTYGNAGYADAQDVSITTTLPSGTTYVETGYAWLPSGDGIYTYAAGTVLAQSTGHTITFTVRHTDTPGISAPEFNTPFAITAGDGTGDDANPDNNTTSVHIGVPDLVVDDLSIEPDIASVQANVPVTFTFTITLMNQGSGWAWNPEDEGGFIVDVFTAPVASYPFQRYGEFSEPSEPISPGLRSAPLVITSPVITPSERGLVFYVKVDNDGLHPYGAVPEFDEMNNLRVRWSPHVFLPLVLRSYPWDTYYEDNDHWLEAYGPLASGQTYQAYPDDAEDYYYFELTTQATVSVSVENFAPTSSNGTVALYGPAVGDAQGDLKAYYGQGGDSSMSLGPLSLSPGKYYVRVFTRINYSMTQLYRLTVRY